LLRRLLLLSAIIVVTNFLLGTCAPTYAISDDEMLFLDALWRVVLGQRVGIDFHFPLGIGPYQLGALLWHWLGPHYYDMRLAITLFNLSIAFCGCIVAERTLARRTNLALPFCVTLAFQVSAPGITSFYVTGLGMAAFYNRQIMSALAVLFLQTFGSRSISSIRGNAIEVALAAGLLNIMFLTKISGFLLGLIVSLAGCLLRGRTAHRILSLCATVLAFAAITAIEFKVAGLEFLPVIKDYRVAAKAVSDSHSFFDVVGNLISWPFVSSVTLLVLFAVSQPFWKLRLRCVGLIIGTYAACQFALNMTNSSGPSMWLAPAAIACLVVSMSASPAAEQAGGSESWWRRFAPSWLAEISVREAIPLIIFVIVLVPEIKSSVVAVKRDALVLLGIEKPYVVTAGKGISFRLLRPRVSLNDAIAAISSLNLSHEKIANLDYFNPFPVLFLAPPPLGIQVYWDFTNNVPEGAPLEWEDVIGDACVVTIPVQPEGSRIKNRLVEVARSKLTTDFETVYQDKFWSIYRKIGGCVSASLL
jgi:hypothetical protein